MHFHRNATDTGNTVEMVGGIQVLRAVAVLVVTICHSQFEVSRIGKLPWAMPAATLDGLAGFGVQLFFVISGFVMVYSSEPLFGTRRGPLIFLERRLVRIVPLYWIVTTIYLALTLLVVKFDKGYPFSFLLASYLFVPAARPDGVIEPLVGQGWSLNYEMFFYFVFALTVCNVRRVSVGIVTAALLAAVAVGQTVSPLPLVISVWTSPLLLYFVFGMWIGLAYREGLSLTPFQGLGLIGIGFFLLFVEFYWAPETAVFGIAVWSIPALIVAGASLPRSTFRSSFWSPVMVIGAASYALYLFHALPIRALFFLAQWAGFDLGHATSVYVCAAVLISIALAIAIYYLVERPLLKALRWRATTKSPRLAVNAPISQPLL
jgi:exopolysaccharide production protein ExoZ